MRQLELRAATLALTGDDTAFVGWERTNMRIVFMECDRIVGASKGDSTRFVKVYWGADGSIHGHPYLLEDVLVELRKNGNLTQYHRLKRN